MHFILEVDHNATAKYHLNGLIFFISKKSIRHSRQTFTISEDKDKKNLDMNSIYELCYFMKNVFIYPDFIEMMKSLGYHRLILMDNFRKPNFELVADILYWMINRIDPTANISDDISTEKKRVFFLKSVASLIFKEIEVKLKLKPLYGGDGYAVKELLKVAKILYSASNMDNKQQVPNVDEVEQSKCLSTLKQAQGIGSIIVQTGARLHELLGQENSIHKHRNKVAHFLDELSYNLESDDSYSKIKNAVHDQINLMCDKINVAKNNIDQLNEVIFYVCTLCFQNGGIQTYQNQKDGKNLMRKITRKENELERLQKRLQSVKNIKPAFMAEFEETQIKNVALYKEWVNKHINLCYLQNELEKYNDKEKQKHLKHEQYLKTVQKKYKEEELKMLRGEDALENLVEDVASNSNVAHSFFFYNILIFFTKQEHFCFFQQKKGLKMIVLTGKLIATKKGSNDSSKDNKDMQSISPSPEPREDTRSQSASKSPTRSEDSNSTDNSQPDNEKSPKNSKLPNSLEGSISDLNNQELQF
ncbi:hypothetical protein RFI_33810 [Reticulomyxa filosa]|uniref:Uncharacterized protein n=1 Tax=Reticulomyxa filosa TaxID=46433 RepID=X6LS59_RETFI|nr:hypothetical protein RFI_33810 [Reticulomyxa filosa]|eukprot:ETO03590.1 hypothetical protein RFI_33810 [Reticulomyxa filosa]